MARITKAELELQLVECQKAGEKLTERLDNALRLLEESRNENHSLEARARNAEAALEDKIKQTPKSFFKRLIGY